MNQEENIGPKWIYGYQYNLSDLHHKSQTSCDSYET